MCDYVIAMCLNCHYFFYHDIDLSDIVTFYMTFQN